MLPQDKVWDEVKLNKEKAGFLADELGISPLVTGILLSRGFETADAMREFLYGKKEPFYDPLQMKDMAKGCQRIEKALATGEQITVYGDYDVDGISASSLLYLYLRQRGGRVNTYIPRRQSEGYGLNDEALKFLGEQGTTLVITVDCGISSVHEVANRPPTMDIVITDHHTVPEQLPAALAIINPHQKDCAYPFKDLTGVGVAFKLCQALERRAGRQWAEMLELVVLGTVADIVPLRDENREIVRRGLRALKSTSLVGLRALLKKACGSEEKPLTADDIAYGLGPRLNAVGRLEHAQRAVELLTTGDEAVAEQIAGELEEENQRRKEITGKIFEEAEIMLAGQDHIDTAIILGSPNWHPGVVGIVASRLVEKYNLPTLLFGFQEDLALGKGSCRSIPALNMYQALKSQEELLVKYGGHHQAAGLTLKLEEFSKFQEGFRQYVETHLLSEDYIKHQRIDYVMECSDKIDAKTVADLQKLEPFGCGNDKPVFALKKAKIVRPQSMGENRRHLRFDLTKGDVSYGCVMWNQGDLVNTLDGYGAEADVAFQPRINEFRGNSSVQLQVVALQRERFIDDRRVNKADKWVYLNLLAKTERKVDVFVEKVEPFRELAALYLGETSRWVNICPYDNLEKRENTTGVCFDLPKEKIDVLVNRLKALGMRKLALLYNEDDFAKWPNAGNMRWAYSWLDKKFRQCGKFSYGEAMREEPHLQMVMVQILQELGLVRLEKGVVTAVLFKATSLEQSPLFVKLSKERMQWEKRYFSNVWFPRNDLIKCFN